MKKITIILLVLFTMTLFSNEISAQISPMKIDTRHPDFDIRVKRCIAKGNTVLLEATFTNTSDTDAKIVVYRSKIFDDEGNEYEVDTKFGNKEVHFQSTEGTLIANVPTKISIKIDNVPSTVESLPLVEFHIIALKFDIQAGYTKMPQIRNIPITRN